MARPTDFDTPIREYWPTLVFCGVVLGFFVAAIKVFG